MTITRDRAAATGAAVRGWTALLGGGAIVQGMWTFVRPQHFYDEFPIEGAAWVSTLGPFNEHLTRDVGAALLGLGVAAVAAARSGSIPGIRAVAAGFAVFGLAHLGYHLGELHHFTAASAIAQVVSLVAVTLLPAGILLAVSEWRWSR